MVLFSRNNNRKILLCDNLDTARPYFYKPLKKKSVVLITTSISGQFRVYVHSLRRPGFTELPVFLEYYLKGQLLTFQSKEKLKGYIT